MGLFVRSRGGSKRTAAKRNVDRISVKKETAPAKAAQKEAVPAASAAEKTVSAEPVTKMPAATVPAETIAPEKALEKEADAVFYYFNQIAAIPHGSHHTSEISDYLVGFAKERGLLVVQDDANNVIITKSASEGYEDAEPIALQGHIDMVLARDPEKKIDLLTEPVTVIEDGDWMHADGTTLGADNGIAVAMMLALLDDDTLRHPLVECIFTADEEVGLIGASSIDLTGLRSRRMLNLDSESEGVFCAGCAGGADVVCTVPVKKKMRNGRILRVKISGLTGGHSGSDIHKGGANAIRLLVRALYSVCGTFPFRLISINGGDANNAIPTNAEAQILFTEKDPADEIERLFLEAGSTLAAEYKLTDPGLVCSVVTDASGEAECVSGKKTRKILEYLMALPTGVTHMNPVIKGMPQTSLNLGIIRTFSDHLQIELMVRSGINSQAGDLCDRLACISSGFGAESFVRSCYPAWEYRKDSPLRDLASAVYRELTGKEPEVEVIHAGLECGILSGKVPGLDCISAGPNMQNVHTPRERVSISSVKNVWNFVLALLEKAAERAAE